MGGFKLKTELAQEGLLGECLSYTILLMAKYPVEIIADLMKTHLGHVRIDVGMILSYLI